MKTIIVWFRNDLRTHDHPALAAACGNAENVIPLFIFDDVPLKGKHASANRNRFLLECLDDLKQSLRDKGADLVIRCGKPVDVLQKIADEAKADAIYYTADYTPYAIKRDAAVARSFKDTSVTFRNYPGRLAVSSLDKIQTKSGTPHKVFTPFWKNWQDIGRREIATLPQKIPFSFNFNIGSLSKLNEILPNDSDKQLSPNVIPGGETEARKRLIKFIDTSISEYGGRNNSMADDATSRLSPYLHFGCISPREIETMLSHSAAANAWHRQLAWREFYHYILYHFPGNARLEFQEKYRSLKWSSSKKMLEAWQHGRTGYPVVDAGMRQMMAEGWMHNRARLIVGSFLTKDLWLDWRDGEHYFMQWLLDGDEANNNGNWQWIASVGVDPAPVYRRLYNPSSQQKSYDPHGTYVRRYVPELAKVPDEFLAEPWKMPEELQQKVGCIIGQDYPAPVIDHAQARVAALEQYRQAK